MLQVDEATYTDLSSLTYDFGGDLKWQWDGVQFNILPDVRRIIRVSAASQLLAVGTNASVTLSTVKADGTLDTGFNGQVIMVAQIGDATKLYRVTFVNGVKVVNIPTTAVNRTIELLSSPFSLVEASMPITIVQDI
jgi:hypothetical protein